MAMNLMQKAKTQLLVSSPFYGTVLVLTPIIATDDVASAATDGRRIFWNPKWFEGLFLPQVVFVLMHEVRHILYRHVQRTGARDLSLWNDACDYVINQEQIAQGYVMPNGDRAGLYDQQFLGMTAEQVYEHLLQNAPPAPKARAFRGDVRPAPADEAEVRALDNHVRTTVAQAATAARLAGGLDDQLAKLVDEILQPQVRWQDVLRAHMTMRAQVYSSWSKRNRRFPSVYLPARGGHRLRRVGCIIDRSLSVEGVVQRFLAEVRAISEDIGAEEVVVRQATTHTTAYDVITRGSPVVLSPSVTGGTDMREPIRDFESDSEAPDVLVLLTDGLTPWPTHPPPFPFIVCCTTDVDVPHGVVVRIDQ